MLHSAWTHNPDATFYLLDCGISSDSRRLLKKFAEEQNIRLGLKRVRTEALGNLPTHRWAAATYARLLIPQVLPSSCEKALYIDADCIIAASLSQFWSLDISKHLFAAVLDEKGRDSEREHGGLQDCPQFANAGVLLMNLVAWRAEKFGDRAIDYGRRNTLVHADQTAINALAQGRVVLVPEIWNYMLSYERVFDGSPVKPSIIHFTGVRKPWLHSDELFAAIYLYHRNRTPFAIGDLRFRYRSRLRFALNLLVLRRTYWRRLRFSLHYERTFTAPYLEKMREPAVELTPYRAPSEEGAGAAR